MGRSKITKDKGTISLTKQLVALKVRYETVKSNLKPDKFIWEGLIQPDPLSGKYRVQIQYKKNSVPKVFIKHPKLLFPNGKNPPHIYKGKNLCLYYPPSEEWTAQKIIAKTIVPWTSLWLHYYEMWLATGKWYGGGIHRNTK
ncbi:hypothetical protein [Aureispira sp. CCB-QB1]|uniref:hypothetical protein n=1 Tax=Aureispira sp. CCB-QB1 TaxID=1313421 RepID=UPI000695E37A|nr:hypothetical protein [Aureispira sp. CCB-QB1]